MEKAIEKMKFINFLSLEEDEKKKDEYIIKPKSNKEYSEQKKKDYLEKRNKIKNK